MPHFYRQPSQSYELSKTVRFFGPPCTHSLYPTFTKSFCYVLHQRNWCSCFCSCDSDGKLILCERYALQLDNTAAFCPTVHVQQHSDIRLLLPTLPVQQVHPVWPLGSTDAVFPVSRVHMSIWNCLGSGRYQLRQRPRSKYVYRLCLICCWLLRTQSRKCRFWAF